MRIKRVRRRVQVHVQIAKKKKSAPYRCLNPNVATTTVCNVIVFLMLRQNESILDVGPEETFAAGFVLKNVRSANSTRSWLWRSPRFRFQCKRFERARDTKYRLSAIILTQIDVSKNYTVSRLRLPNLRSDRKRFFF